MHVSSKFMYSHDLKSGRIWFMSLPVFIVSVVSRQLQVGPPLFVVDCCVGASDVVHCDLSFHLSLRFLSLSLSGWLLLLIHSISFVRYL